MLTQKEAAAVMGVAEHTFIDFLQRFKKAREAWTMGQDLGRVSIRRMQFMHGKKNPGAAIWLGKIYLGQREQTQIGVGGIPGAPPVGIEHTAGRGLTALLEAARRNAEAAAGRLTAPPQDPTALLAPEREPILKPQEAPPPPEASAATTPSARPGNACQGSAPGRRTPKSVKGSRPNASTA